MNCPECDIEMELSWKRYLSAPFGRYKCPECSSKFKFNQPLWLKLLLPIIQCAFILSCGALIIKYMVGDCTLGSYAKPMVVFVSLLSIVLFCTADKYLKRLYETVRV